MSSTGLRGFFQILLGLCIVLLVGFGAAFFGVKSQLIDNLDRQLAEDAENVTRVLENPAAELDEVDPLDPVRRVSARSTATLVLDADGSLSFFLPSGASGTTDAAPDFAVVGYDELRARVGTPMELSSTDGAVDYRVAVEVVPSTGQLVVVGSSLDQIDQPVRVLAWVLGITLVGTLAVLGILAWMTVRSSLRPYQEMIDMAADIAEGDLSRRATPGPDNTDLTRLATSLNVMLDQLESSFSAREASEERLRRFAADASHELRTPLTTISGYAELYRTGMISEPDDVARAMDRIERETGRMSRLVEDLLVLARLDQRRPLELEPLELASMLEDLVDDARAADPDRLVLFTPPERHAIVSGDEDRIRQSIANLLANTRAHTPPGTRVEVSMHVVGHSAGITVADDGPGMTEQDAEHVFDRFFRAEGSRSRSTGGSGLGLSIVAAVVEAHGGIVELDTAPGEGTSFTVWLPVDEHYPATAGGRSSVVRAGDS